MKRNFVKKWYQTPTKWFLGLFLSSFLLASCNPNQVVVSSEVKVLNQKLTTLVVNVTNKNQLASTVVPNQIEVLADNVKLAASEYNIILEPNDLFGQLKVLLNLKSDDQLSSSRIFVIDGFSQTSQFTTAQQLNQIIEQMQITFLGDKASTKPSTVSLQQLKMAFGDKAVDVSLFDATYSLAPNDDLGTLTVAVRLGLKNTSINSDVIQKVLLEFEKTAVVVPQPYVMDQDNKIKNYLALFFSIKATNYADLAKIINGYLAAEQATKAEYTQIQTNPLALLLWSFEKNIANKNETQALAAANKLVTDLTNKNLNQFNNFRRMWSRLPIFTTYLNNFAAAHATNPSVQQANMDYNQVERIFGLIIKRILEDLYYGDNQAAAQKILQVNDFELLTPRYLGSLILGGYEYLTKEVLVKFSKSIKYFVPVIGETGANEAANYQINPKPTKATIDSMDNLWYQLIARTIGALLSTVDDQVAAITTELSAWMQGNLISDNALWMKTSSFNAEQLFTNLDKFRQLIVGFSQDKQVVFAKEPIIAPILAYAKTTLLVHKITNSNVDTVDHLNLVGLMSVFANEVNDQLMITTLKGLLKNKTLTNQAKFSWLQNQINNLQK